jgi:flagella basal body P-ring formation protein FlgA
MRPRIASLLLLLSAAAAPAFAGTAAPVLSDAAREALRAHLVEQAGIPGVEAFVGSVRIHEPKASGGTPEILRVGTDGPARSGRGIAFFLFVRDADGFVREMRASADVSLLVPVVVSVRNVPAGAVIGDGDVALRKRELVSGNDDLLHRESDAVGKRARWQLSGGVPVKRDYLEDPEAVRRGDAVQIVAEAGPVRITGKGISLQAGRVGETVLVRNAGTGREIAGRLEAGRVVRVD